MSILTEVSVYRKCPLAEARLRLSFPSLVLNNFSDFTDKLKKINKCISKSAMMLPGRLASTCSCACRCRS